MSCTLGFSEFYVHQFPGICYFYQYQTPFPCGYHADSPHIEIQDDHEDKFNIGPYRKNMNTHSFFCFVFFFLCVDLKSKLADNTCFGASDLLLFSNLICILKIIETNESCFIFLFFYS